MFPVAVVIAAAAAASGALGGSLARKDQRDQARRAARQQKRMLEEQRRTTLGNMENSMILNMEGSAQTLYDYQGEMNDQATQSAYSTYLTEEANSAQYLKDVAASVQGGQEAAAIAGASGAKADVNIQTVIDNTIAQDLATERKAMAGQRVGAMYSFNQGVDKFKTAIARESVKYDEGNALMRAYRFQVDQVNRETDLGIAWQDKILKDNSYEWSLTNKWFQADMLGWFAASNTGYRDAYQMTNGFTSSGFPGMNQSASASASKVDAVSHG